MDTEISGKYKKRTIFESNLATKAGRYNPIKATKNYVLSSSSCSKKRNITDISSETEQRSMIVSDYRKVKPYIQTINSIQLSPSSSRRKSSLQYDTSSFFNISNNPTILHTTSSFLSSNKFLGRSNNNNNNNNSIGSIMLPLHVAISPNTFIQYQQIQQEQNYENNNQQQLITFNSFNNDTSSIQFPANKNCSRIDEDEIIHQNFNHNGLYLNDTGEEEDTKIQATDCSINSKNNAEECSNSSFTTTAVFI